MWNIKNNVTMKYMHIYKHIGQAAKIMNDNGGVDDTAGTGYST